MDTSKINLDPEVLAVLSNPDKLRQLQALATARVSISTSNGTNNSVSNGMPSNTTVSDSTNSSNSASNSKRSIFSNFPTKSNKKVKKTAEKIYSRHVYLCSTIGQKKQYTADEEDEKGPLGYIKRPVYFSTTNTEEEVMEKLKELFRKKLFGDDIQILYCDKKNMLKEFYLPPGIAIDGKFLMDNTKGGKFYVRQVIHLNKDCIEVEMTPGETSHVIAPGTILSDVFNNLRDRINNSATTLHIQVRRGYVLEDLKPYLKNNLGRLFGKLKVTFVHEPAVGIGTLKDMFGSAVRQIKESDLLFGTETSKTMMNYSIALREGTYERFGEIIALSIVHGGPHPTFLSRTFARALLGSLGEDEEIPLCDVLNMELHQILQELCETKSLDKINEILAAHDLFTWASTYRRVSGKNFLRQRDAAAKRAIRYITVEHVEPCLKAFAKGMEKEVQLLSLLKTAPVEAEAFFCYVDRNYSAKEILAEFQVSEKDRKSNSFKLFTKYVEDIAGDGEKVKQLFKSVTGFPGIPPLGFGLKRPNLSVSPSSAEVSTSLCANEIRLPEIQLEYAEFADLVEEGILDKKEVPFNHV